MCEIPIVSIRNVSKTFIQNSGDFLEVLQNISFDVQRNEIVAIIGHSGCGKTTLLRIACALEVADDGIVLLDGCLCVHPSKNMLMLYQDFNQLFPWKTVLENVVHSLVATKMIKDKRAAKSRAIESIVDVGLSGFENSYPHQLSGGMKQRAIVARALVLKPLVLLMDEPFGSLDDITRSTLQILTRQVCKRYGISALFVTHSIEEAVVMSDKIVIMDKNPGRIKAILKNDVITEAYSCQANFAIELQELLRS
jgi:NitT/TauT family transport system ATP-binding protein